MIRCLTSEAYVIPSIPGSLPAMSLYAPAMVSTMGWSTDILEEAKLYPTHSTLGGFSLSHGSAFETSATLSSSSLLASPSGSPTATPIRPVKTTFSGTLPGHCPPPRSRC